MKMNNVGTIAGTTETSINKRIQEMRQILSSTDEMIEEMDTSVRKKC